MNCSTISKNKYLKAMFFFIVIITVILLAPTAQAVQIYNIPEYGQRTGFTIPYDVNSRGVWIDTTDNGSYVDCGMVCLSMVEAYFAGYNGGNEYVYYRVYAARNPNVAWSDLTGDTFVTSQPYPVSGYADYSYMSPEDVLAQLNNGNPVLVHRWGSSEHWVLIYGYDGPTDNVNWTSFKIMSPTYDAGVQYMYLSSFVSDYGGNLNHFMYRTSGILPNKRNPVNLGETLQTKIHLVQDNKAIVAKDSGNVELDSDHYTANQDWRFDRMSNGTYIITNLKDGRVLELGNGETGNGANICLHERWPDSNPSQRYQRWYIYDNGSGYYRLSPEAAPSRSLDATGGSTVDGTNIQLFDSNDTIAQRLRFDAFDGSILTEIVCSKQDIILKPGHCEQLEVSYRPVYGIPLSNRGVVWMSSNNSVAIVDDTGMVTALGEGTCTITVTSTYNDLINATCVVNVESALDVPEIISLIISGQTARLSWNASPLTDDNDVRAYEVFVYPKGNIDDYVWSNWNVTNTSCDIVITAHGQYVAYVRAVNRTDDSRSNFNSKEFTILEGDWIYLETLPDDLPEGEVQYLNHYTLSAKTSPGDEWELIKEGDVQYENDGDPYEVDNELSTSATRVLLGNYYFHYCNGGADANYYRIEGQFPNKHSIAMAEIGVNFNPGFFKYDGDGSGREVYLLKHLNGQYAGYYAGCNGGGSQAWYKGYVYQNRKAYQVNTYQMMGDWTDTIDTTATSVEYRIRLKQYTVAFDGNGGIFGLEGLVKYSGTDLILPTEEPVRDLYDFVSWNTQANGMGENYMAGAIYSSNADVILYAQWREKAVLYLPGDLQVIEEEAFSGVSATIVQVPSSCTTIKSKAFANCKALQRIYIPISTENIALNAFTGCTNLTIYAPAGSEAIRVAKYNDIPYVEE